MNGSSSTAYVPREYARINEGARSAEDSHPTTPTYDIICDYAVAYRGACVERMDSPAASGLSSGDRKSFEDRRPSGRAIELDGRCGESGLRSLVVTSSSLCHSLTPLVVLCLNQAQQICLDLWRKIRAQHSMDRLEGNRYNICATFTARLRFWR